MTATVASLPRRRHSGGPDAVTPTLARAFGRTAGGMQMELHGPDGVKAKLERIHAAAKASGHLAWFHGWARTLRRLLDDVPSQPYGGALERAVNGAENKEHAAALEFHLCQGVEAARGFVRALEREILEKTMMRDALVAAFAL